ncbi:MAG TPA: hypothetical protein VE198_16215 [Actinoallomurus sp.]|jgi:hypothetical protein|nr:hypothetical protein [Actinoallomurus sp.]
MTQPFDDEYGDRLRRALHAEAEAVTPSAEGLERIRSKINDKRERRFGFSLTAPWMRPLAALTAAVFVCGAAVTATPALKNFVQTGHFSDDSGSGDPGRTSNGGRSQGEVVPGGSPDPAPSTSPSPSAIRTPNAGKHVVSGSTCQPGWTTVTPSGSPAVAPTEPGTTVTCQPGEGSDPASPPVTEQPPPVSSPPDVPTDPPPASVPNANPNQSP